MDYGFHDSSGADYTQYVNNTVEGAITSKVQTLGTNSSYSDLDVASRSFTPTVTFATAGDFAPTYNTQVGRYRLIGDLVFFNLILDFDTNAYTTASGNIRVGGLPQTARSGNDGNFSVSVGRHSKINLAGGYTQVGAVVAGGNTFMQLFQSGDALNQSPLTASNFAASTSGFYIELSGFYPYSNVA
jgi:hypothetical protein